MSNNGVGFLQGLETCFNWLKENPGKYAAVVGAERWVEAIDREGKASTHWGLSDGGGAIVLGSPGGSSIAEVLGFCYKSSVKNSGFSHIKHGGTRFFWAPSAEEARVRISEGVDKETLFAEYEQAYQNLGDNLSKRFGKSEGLVINQVNPQLVREIAPTALDIAKESVFDTGFRRGHIGGIDIAVGLEEAAAKGKKGLLTAISSSPSCWGSVALRFY